MISNPTGIGLSILYNKEWPNRNKKGVILFIVLGVIIVSTLLAAVILKTISNQSRLTHHQVSRIQAQYAAKAGVLLALDKLRIGDVAWPATGTTKRMCKQVIGPDCSTPDILEPNLPNSIQYVEITVGALNSGISETQKVSAKAVYTYTP